MSAIRGRWRGSSNSRGRSSFSYTRALGKGSYPGDWKKQSAEIPRSPSPPVGTILTTFHGHDLVESPDFQGHSVRITGCRDITSYNWINKSEPTILVPGKPPAWTPLSSSRKLKQDDGEYFRDPNAARYPSHPLEPAVQAIFTSESDFPTSSIDIFACSSTLGNLLRFVRKVDKPFRILVEVVGDTVFLMRRENSPTELIPDVRGYGHTFPETYTTWEADVKGSESHQHIIRYKFGGLDCLIRFEADGYHRNLILEETEGWPNPARAGTLESTLASALAESTIVARPSAQDRPLNVVRGGRQVPLSAIFDLKTRSSRKKDEDTLAEQMPRLWVSQIPNFILAYHTSGIFEDIQTRDVRREVEDWERENEDVLQQLALLLRKIVAFSRGRRDGKLELRREKVDELELREQCEDVGSALPAALEERWIMGPSHRPERTEPSTDGSPISHARFDPGLDDDWDEGSDKDFTACSAEDCGYCGHCAY